MKGVNEAEILVVQTRHDAPRHAAINVAIAKAYLLGSDPKRVERTWSFVLDEFCSRGKETTRRRNLRAAQSITRFANFFRSALVGPRT